MARISGSKSPNLSTSYSQGSHSSKARTALVDSEVSTRRSCRKSVPTLAKQQAGEEQEEQIINKSKRRHRVSELKDYDAPTATKKAKAVSAKPNPANKAPQKLQNPTFGLRTARAMVAKKTPTPSAIEPHIYAASNSQTLSFGPRIDRSPQHISSTPSRSTSELSDEEFIERPEPRFLSPPATAKRNENVPEEQSDEYEQEIQVGSEQEAIELSSGPMLSSDIDDEDDPDELNPEHLQEVDSIVDGVEQELHHLARRGGSSRSHKDIQEEMQGLNVGIADGCFFGVTIAEIKSSLPVSLVNP